MSKPDTASEFTHCTAFLLVLYLVIGGEYYQIAKGTAVHTQISFANIALNKITPKQHLHTSLWIQQANVLNFHLHNSNSIQRTFIASNLH